MKTWKVEVTISVADSWVADGFNLQERIENGEFAEHLQRMLPYAYGHEVAIKTKVLRSPDARLIEGLQNGAIAIKD